MQQGVLQNVSFAVVNADHEQNLAGRLMQGGSIPQLVMYRRTPRGWLRRRLIRAHSVGATSTFITEPVPTVSDSSADKTTQTK